MKKRIVILIVATIACAAIITALFQYGYFEYLLDSGKIDRTDKDYSVVVTLSIGPNALIIVPYVHIIQIKSDKTITENTFRVIEWPNNRTYDDKVIKGSTRTLSDDEYDTLLDILRNSDYQSIQREIDIADPWVDGNSTYITVRDGNSNNTVGGHCAEHKDERFKNIMDYVLGLLV